MSLYRQAPKRDKPEVNDPDRQEPSPKRSKQSGTRQNHIPRPDAEEDHVQVLSESRGVQQPPRRADNVHATTRWPTVQRLRPTPQLVRAQPQTASVQQSQARQGGEANVNSRRSGFMIPQALLPVPNGLPPAPDRPRDPQLVELPFCKTIQELCPMTTLKSEGTLRFDISAETAVQMRGPDVLVKLRLFRTGPPLLLDEVPEDCVVRVNDREVRDSEGMPERVPTHRPNQPTHRKPRPIDLTQAFRRLLDSSVGRRVRIAIGWKTVPGQRWSAGVWMVKKLDVETLFKNLVSNEERRLPRDVMLTRLRGYSNTNDADDALTTLSAPTVSLNCPITMARIRTPVRGVNCVHLDCFDLRNYLTMNECDPRWMCPLCRREARYSNLRVDTYFEEILARVGGSLTRLELASDGTWRDAEERAKQRQQQRAVVDNQTLTVVASSQSALPMNTSGGDQAATSPSPAAQVELSGASQAPTRSEDARMDTSDVGQAMPSLPAAEQADATVHEQTRVDGQPTAVPQHVLETFKHPVIFEDSTIVLVASSHFNPITGERGRAAREDYAL